MNEQAELASGHTLSNGILQVSDSDLSPELLEETLAELE